MLGFRLPVLSRSAAASTPVVETLTRSTAPLARSFTNTSGTPFRSIGTRFEAVDSKATQRPSAEMRGSSDGPLACTPEEDVLTRSVSQPLGVGELALTMNCWVAEPVA